MALFGLKKNKEAVPAKSAKKAVAKHSAVEAPAFVKAKADKTVILRPHITEKATMRAESGVYTFDVARGTNKIEIKKAIKKLYKVTPVAVRIVNAGPRRELQSRTRRMILRSGSKKAYVTLKKGDQISFV